MLVLNKDRVIYLVRRPDHVVAAHVVLFFRNKYLCNHINYLPTMEAKAELSCNAKIRRSLLINGRIIDIWENMFQGR